MANKQIPLLPVKGFIIQKYLITTEEQNQDIFGDEIARSLPYVA